MNSDKLINKIAELIYVHSHPYIAQDRCQRVIDDINFLLAPELEKAAKWDDLGYVTSYVEPENYEEIKEKARLWTRVKEIDNSDTCDGCKYAPYASSCVLDECAFRLVVNALEGEKDV